MKKNSTIAVSLYSHFFCDRSVWTGRTARKDRLDRHSLFADDKEGVTKYNNASRLSIQK